jgi:hypothetical protein
VLGNNDLHAAYYFSNRLPVAMMSSVPIVHGFERGLDVVVPGWLGVSWFSSTSEAWDAFNRAAETPPDAGTREAAREFARDRLSTRAALSYMSQVLAAVRESRLTGGPAQPVPNLWGVDLARRSDS